MSKEIAKKVETTTPPAVAIQQVDEETLRSYLFWLKDPITEKQQDLFLQISKANNLNPFKREVYAVGYGDNFSIVTGYQVYIDKANATGLLNGWACEIIKDEKWEIEWAKVIIHRKDWDKPFEWVVDFDEFAWVYFDKTTKKMVLNKIWKTKGKFMIKKVAIGQGFRLCFPTELWSLPYLAEEIANKDDREVMDGQIEEDDTPETTTPTHTATVDLTDAELKETPPTPPIQENIEDGATLEDVEQAFDDGSAKLPANKVKQVQIKWKEFAEKSGWNFEDSEKKRKATMKKYFWVDSANQLSPEQADEFVQKINDAIEKIK